MTPSPESTTTPLLRPDVVRHKPLQISISDELTLRVQRQHGLNRHVDAAKVVALQHDLAHLLAVLERVHGRLREEDLAPGRVDLHLLVEGVVPQMLHIIPLLHDAVFHLPAVSTQYLPTYISHAVPTG